MEYKTKSKYFLMQTRLPYVRIDIFTVVTMRNAVCWDLRSVDLVRTKISEERNASIIRVTRIDELGTTLAVTSNRRTLRRNTQVYRTRASIELPDIMTSVLTRATRRNIPEDAFLHNHRRENLKSYKNQSYLNLSVAFTC
jgi:hypothetical protein